MYSDPCSLIEQFESNSIIWDISRCKLYIVSSHHTSSSYYPALSHRGLSFSGLRGRKESVDMSAAGDRFVPLSAKKGGGGIAGGQKRGEKGYVK